MRPMRRSIPALMLALMLLVPAAAVAGSAPKGPPDATVTIRVGHLHGGKAGIYDTVPVEGTVAPFVAGQHVAVTFYLDGHVLLTRNVAVQPGKAGAGRFSASIVVREDGKYAVAAKHVATAALGGDETVRKSWRVSFPALHPGECDKVVKGFKKAMAKLGYAAGGGRCFNGRLGREVLAYRKVSGMDRTEPAGHWPLHLLPSRTGLQLGGHVLLLLLAQRLRGPRLRRSPHLRRQPRLRAYLHRRPAAHLLPTQLRREHLCVLSG